MAARSVGTVDITVNADTGELAAQIRKDAKRDGRAYKKSFERETSRLQAAIDDAGAAREAQRAGTLMATRMEAQLNGLDVGLDLTEARAQFLSIKEQIEADDIVLALALDEISAREAQARIATLTEDEQLDVLIQLEQAGFQAQLEAIEAVERELEFTADLTEARNALRAFEIEVERFNLDLDVDVDLVGARAAIARFRALQENNDIEVEYDISVDRLDAALNRIEASSLESGEKSGSNFAQGFGSSSSGSWGDETKLLIAAIAATGDALAAALSGGLAAATSVVSSGFTALAAAAGAALPVVSSLVAVVTAGVVGFQEFGTATSAINEEFADAAKEGRTFNIEAENIQSALSRLAPEAADTAIAFASIRDELDDLRLDVQQSLFEDMDGVLISLGRTTIPNISSALSSAAGTLNEFGQQLAFIAEDTDFAGMFEDVEPAVDAVFDAITDVVGTFEPFIEAAGPAAERLAEYLHQGADQLRRWVENNPDEIAEFLDDGLDSLSAWVRLLQRTGDLLGTVFAAGQESGDGFVLTLGTIVERWDSFLESTEGQSKLADWFASGQRAMDSMKPILDGIVEAFDRLVSEGSFDNFDQLAVSIGAILPTLAELLSLLGNAGLLTAILSILNAIQPLLNVLNAFPGPLLEVVGAMAAVVLIGAKVTAGIKAVREAMALMTAQMSISTPQLLAISAAVAVVVVGMSYLSGGTDEVAERTAELSLTLDGVVDGMIREADAADNATIALDALSKSLIASGEDGTKLQKALGAVGLDAEDATDALLNLGADPLSAMQELAEGMGLTADEAKELAEIVNSTDDQFDVMTQAATRLGEGTALSAEEIVYLASQLEELQDQAEKTDVTGLVQEQFELARGSAEVSDSVKDLIPALDELATMTEKELVDAYNAFLQAQAKEIEATEEGVEAAERYAAAHRTQAEILELETQAREAAIEALQEEGRAAYDTAKEAEYLDRATRSAVQQMLAGQGVSSGFTNELYKIGDAAADASEAASDLTSSLDILFGRALSSQEAFDGFYSQINEITEAMKENELEQISFTEALFGTSEGAIEFREAMREGAQGIFDYATAATEAGEDSAIVNANVAAMRDSLVAAAAQFGITSVDAQAYIDTLIGTPELLSTIIETPGMFEALLNAENLNVLYDEAGNPVLTEFEAAGLDTALADSDEFRSLIIELSGMSADPSITATTAPPTQAEIDGVQDATDQLEDSSADPDIEASGAAKTKSDIEGVTDAVVELDETSADPEVEVSDYAGVRAQFNILIDLADELNETDPVVNITLPGINTRIAEVNELIRRIAAITSKTVTITTRQVSVGGDMTGGIESGLGSGQRVGFPMTLDVGERGYREAVIPLDLPLNRVDPSVRSMAELIRSGGRPDGGQSSPGTVHNHEWNIVGTQDPEATATKVMNRLVAQI